MSKYEKGVKSHAWFERELIESAALGKLTGAAPRVLMIFFTRRQMRNVSKGKEKTWQIGNNGDLIFTYTEAKDTYGLTAPRFKRALAELVQYGFIDITNPSAQIAKEPTRFTLSGRWRRYGEPDFELVTMSKGRRWIIGK